MDFCLQNMFKLQGKLPKDMLKHIQGGFVWQVVYVLETHRALRISPLNVFQDIESISTYCCLAPVHEQNPLAQKARNQ